MVLEIIIIKFSCILKIMSRNTFPEPQPDSASYTTTGFIIEIGTPPSHSKWNVTKNGMPLKMIGHSKLKVT